MTTYENVSRILDRYLQLIETESFAKYEKDFAQRIQIALSENYMKGINEIKIVSIIEDIVNNLDGLSISVDQVNMSTKGIFIHGSKSLVEFDYYGEKTQTELGDLIFILSVIFNKVKYFEKLTISQFKKAGINFRWNIKRDQLYLLSRFPSFKGVRGLIPNKKYYLPNFSGSLGSYSLIYSPGVFSFVSASRLSSYIGNKKSLNITDIFKLQEPIFCYFPPFIPEIISIVCELLEIESLTRHFHPHFMGVLGLAHWAPNTYDFVDKYLRGCIGELCFSKAGIYNSQVRKFIEELLSAVKIKAIKERNEKIIRFVNEFFEYPYGVRKNKREFPEEMDFDFKGGGLGIIQTVINLGGE